MSAGYSIWLCGSWARGDADDASDVDVACFGDAPAGIESMVGLLPSGPVEIVRRSWQETDRMCRVGAMFLQHIRAEGRLLLEVGHGAVRFRESLESLPPYAGGIRAFAGFNLTVRDVQESIQSGDYSAPFELSVLAAVLRHAAIVTSVALGQPSFGRLEPFDRLKSAIVIDSQMVRSLEMLYDYKLLEDRRMAQPRTRFDDSVDYWLSTSYALIAKMEAVAT